MLDLGPHLHSFPNVLYDAQRIEIFIIFKFFTICNFIVKINPKYQKYMKPVGTVEGVIM